MVDAITIDGISDYSKSTDFQHDSPVIIYYHVASNDLPKANDARYQYSYWVSYADINTSIFDAAFKITFKSGRHYQIV